MDGGFFQSFDRKRDSREIDNSECVDKISDKEQNHKKNSEKTYLYNSHLYLIYEPISQNRLERGNASDSSSFSAVG
jgi:hypothetical protein